MQNIDTIFVWIQNNKEWLFDGLGVCVLGALGGILGKFIYKQKRTHEGKEQGIQAKKENVEIAENIIGNGNVKANIVNVYGKELEKKENKDIESWFADRFYKMLELLNDARTSREKEYTIEYVSALIGLENVSQLKQYLNSDMEPDDAFKQKFVDVFGVNKEWMLYGRGEFPFHSNIEIFDNYPMDILRNENLSEIKSFIIVIGVCEGKRYACIIRKMNDFRYEFYPKRYILNANVGANGIHKLSDFYRFVQEAWRINKLEYCVYEATEQQFLDLYNGDIAPKKVMQFQVSKWFIDKILDLSDYSIEDNARFWDNDLIEVQKIIKVDLPLRKKVDEENDRKLITKNMGKINLEGSIEGKCMQKRVFISYSWTPESNKAWVRKLVEKLEKDGVQVVIDYKDLKLGNDKYAFMERMVADETIDKVLIICNKAYMEKADSRRGGVGDESAIITPKIYGNVKQEKFIPVVNEYSEQRQPYLPHYLASRMYADLVNFDKGYLELLDNILGDDIRRVVEEKTETEKKEVVSDDIRFFSEPTPFFDHRFRKAFPGISGLKEFTVPSEGVDRLEILLREPLNRESRKMTDPIWWFRGGSNLDIGKFKRLSPTKFLMDSDEIEVKKVIAYASSYYFRKFVYVEAYPEKTCGVYGEVNQEHINEMTRLTGEYHEEYALYKGHVITRAEYDDGAAVIDGKVVDCCGEAELRVRYLTPYNFIICAKWNPLNENMYDGVVEKILNGMLNGTNTIDELVDLCEKAPRHKMDM